MKFLLLPLALFILLDYFPSSSHVHEDWSLQKDKEGVKVYTRKLPGAKLKEMRIRLQVEASFSSIIALIYDTDAYEEWVYKSTGNSETLEINEDFTGYYYSLFDFPWPFRDRDIVIYSDFKQTPESKTMMVFSEAKPDYKPEVDGVIRVKKHYNSWTFTSLGDGKVDVDYFFRSDPEGHVPAWLVNMVIDNGSIYTMTNFRRMLKKEKYANASLEYVIEPRP